MEMTDRPHRPSSNNNAGGELFICFTSRLSSSMKLPSKSILSPARPKDSSLSTSLSRRLRPSPSLRNAQASPMFPPTTGKKRGCGFDNPEPTSPKVTCIGQVRVKTKAKKILLPTRSSKPRPPEVSFRKIDPSLDNMAAAHLHSQQECRKWVHLPVTICEALRAVGTEFNCFLPCRSSCMANHRDKQEKASSDAGGSGGNGGGGSSCGAVLARWLVAAVQEEGEGEGRGGGRQIDLVVGEEEEEDIIRSSHRRHHVFEDIEINLCENEKEKEEQGGRVSICIPPKNALLLMRCRSDPVKLAALANRSWEQPAQPTRQHCLMEEEDEEDEQEKDEKPAAAYLRKPETEQRECSKEVSSSSVEKLLPPPKAAEQQNLDRKDESALDKEQDEDFLQGLESPRLEETTDHESPAEGGEEDAEITAGVSFSAQGMEQVDTAHESPEETAQFVEAAEECKPILSSSEQENGNDQVESEPEPELVSGPHFDDTNHSEETRREQEFVEAKNEEASASPASEVHEATEKTEENGGPEPPDPEEHGSKQEDKLLPDCLLLMMCEPKLSMEVSKETWVCSRDFIRWQPQKQRAVKVKRKDCTGPDEDESKRRITADRKPVLLQPPRSSCSFPVALPRVGAGGGGGSIARMIEQKLADGGKGCEPFVLTRCKSEPMRSVANLAADNCFWKNLKLEPATLGVGAAAGVGFGSEQ